MRLLTPRSPEIEGQFAGTYRACCLPRGNHMTITLIALACFASLLYYRWRGPVMFEATRSYLYLEALRAGATNDEANDRAALKEKDVTHAIAHHAKFHRWNAYRKKVLGSHVWPQIGEAYRRGMSPPLLPDTLWQTVYDWSRKDDYPFPPVLRAKLLVRDETPYEAYYSNTLTALAAQTGMDLAHLAELVGRIDDEGCRNAFNGQIPPTEWANTLYDIYIRDGAPLAKDIL
jgi:hypothetical protein